jgi:hypothetical protein
MKTTTLVKVSAAIEAATGVALIAVPELVARVLLGAELSSSGIAVARVAGFGLLALGLACWSGDENATPQSVRALIVYNLLAGLYLGYLRFSGEFVSYLLWPACAVHLVIGIALVILAYGSHSPEKRSRA